MQALARMLRQETRSDSSVPIVEALDLIWEHPLARGPDGDRQLERWLAELASETWPMSEPLIDRRARHYQWTAERGDLDIESPVHTLNRRLIDKRFIIEISAGGPLSNALRLLRQHPATVDPTERYYAESVMRSLLRIIREHHRTAEWEFRDTLPAWARLLTPYGLDHPPPIGPQYEIDSSELAEAGDPWADAERPFYLRQSNRIGLILVSVVIVMLGLILIRKFILPA